MFNRNSFFNGRALVSETAQGRTALPRLDLGAVQAGLTRWKVLLPPPPPWLYREDPVPRSLRVWMAP